MGVPRLLRRLRISSDEEGATTPLRWEDAAFRASRRAGRRVVPSSRLEDVERREQGGEPARIGRPTAGMADDDHAKA